VVHFPIGHPRAASRRSEAATSVALRVIESLKEPITAGSVKHQVGAGIGISLIPGDAATPEQALRKADRVLRIEDPLLLHAFTQWRHHRGGRFLLHQLRIVDLAGDIVQDLRIPSMIPMS
jgi:hypothetical protein